HRRWGSFSGTCGAAGCDTWRRSACVTCVLAGAGANALAILLNGGMPYSATAARAVGLTVDDETVRNTVAGEDTRQRLRRLVIAVLTLASTATLLYTLGRRSTTEAERGSPGRRSGPYRGPVDLEVSGEIWYWRGPAPWYFV